MAPAGAAAGAAGAAAAAAADRAPVPPQVKAHPELYDFRHMADGPRGYKTGVTKKGTLGTKRKLDAYAEQVEADAAEAAMRDPAADAPTGILDGEAMAKRVKHNALGVGRGSGRAAWKAPENRTTRSGMATSWASKMRSKAERASYKGRKDAAEAARAAAKRAKREQREAAAKRKEENRRASEVSTRVTAKTARRMAKSKKLRKKLVTVA
jgi:hypothetical protein